MAKVKTERAKPKKISTKELYKREATLTPGGHKYYRYVRDENGEKIFRDDVDPAIIKAAQEADNAAEGKIRKASRKASRRIVPEHILDRMKTATCLRAQFGDKDVYRIILDEKYLTGEDTGWVIMVIDKQHAQNQKRIFFNLYSQEWMLFDPEVHKPGYGNAAIIWPKSIVSAKAASDLAPEPKAKSKKKTKTTVARKGSKGAKKKVA